MFNAESRGIRGERRQTGEPGTMGNRKILGVTQVNLGSREGVMVREGKGKPTGFNFLALFVIKYDLTTPKIPKLRRLVCLSLEGIGLGIRGWRTAGKGFTKVG